MRVLVLTNSYPPDSKGGMGLSCRETVTGLQNRGHEVLVLTGKSKIMERQGTRSIARDLYREVQLAQYRNAWGFFTSRSRREAENREVLLRHIQGFRPEVTFIWGMWNLHHSLAADAERLMGGKVLYCFGDYWPTLPSPFDFYWRARGRGRASEALKSLIRPVALQMLRNEKPVQINIPHSYCVSHATRKHLLNCGVPVGDSQVIHNGIELSSFKPAERRTSDSRYRLLYVGRLAPEKGVGAAVDVLSRLKASDNGDRNRWRLTLVGAGDSNHENELQLKVENLGLSSQVQFSGHVPHRELPGLYRDHGVLLVPSLWEEPFGRVVVEGMASMCLVVASRRGALPEIVRHEESGILFKAGDVQELAKWLEFAASNPEWVTSITSRARHYVLNEFTFEKMMTKVEGLLHRVASPDLDRVVNRAGSLAIAQQTEV